MKIATWNINGISSRLDHVIKWTEIAEPDVLCLQETKTPDAKFPSAKLQKIGYEHIAELGGRRGDPRGADPSPNAYWRVRSFRNYADYALTAPFTAGMARLRERGSGHRCAIMCAEAVWWRCHRRIIGDYLLAAGERVMHILGTSHVDEAHLTPGAVLRNDGTVVYPAESPRLG